MKKMREIMNCSRSDLRAASNVIGAILCFAVPLVAIVLLATIGWDNKAAQVTTVTCFYDNIELTSEGRTRKICEDDDDCDDFRRESYTAYVIIADVKSNETSLTIDGYEINVGTDENDAKKKAESLETQTDECYYRNDVLTFKYHNFFVGEIIGLVIFSLWLLALICGMLITVSNG